MNFDFKITCWERVNVPEEFEQEVLQAIKDGKIDSAQGIFDFLEMKTDDIDCFKLDVPEEQMDLVENQYNSTIEVQDDDLKYVFWNGGNKEDYEGLNKK